jgi:hypothetical protein
MAQKPVLTHDDAAPGCQGFGPRFERAIVERLRAESHLFELAPIQNRGEQRSTLAQEGYVAGPRRILGKGGVQADRRIHDLQTVGANHGAWGRDAVCSWIWRSSSTPCGPLSLNPAEITIADFTPASMHSPIMCGTVGAGVATTARSTFSGISPMDGYAVSPQISE